MPTAILIDGGFFLKRYQTLMSPGNSPRVVANDVHRMSLEHLNQDVGRGRVRKARRSLYRIFYYDCPPLTKKAHHPLTKASIDFSKSDVSKWRREYLEELRKKRKVALRLGYLNDRTAAWQIRTDKLKALLNNKITVDNLAEDDVYYHAMQKGVDMRIGLDIASMAFKKQVDQIVLVAGDSDFVPAAKLARREGIDFILDPMYSPIRDDLNEHIDGLRSTLNRLWTIAATAPTATPTPPDASKLSTPTVDPPDSGTPC